MLEMKCPCCGQDVDKKLSSVFIKNQTVWHKGRPIHLSKTQFYILEYLYKHIGHMVDPMDLMWVLYNEDMDARDISNITVQIFHLRKSLRKEKIPLSIESIRGRGNSGYRLLWQ